MRKAILIAVVIMAMAATSTLAVMVDDPCKVFEYAEIKDMTDQELQSEIDAAQRKDLGNMEYGNKMAGHSGRVADNEAQNAYKNSRLCREQSERLWSAKKKRPSYVAQPPKTYESCVDELKAVGETNFTFCERLLKL